MMDDMPAPVRLADYRPFGRKVERVSLTLRLSPSNTRVLSRIQFGPRRGDAPPVFRLDGEGLTTLSMTIDGLSVAARDVDRGIEIDNVPDGPFLWEAEVEINPKDNTMLEGLYLSRGVYCTQCEAEGFRRITWYPDRPDVMAPFDVRIEADTPVLLSNGNRVAAGEGFAEWHDPWPKPAYLFALVAGDLVATTDRFVTSGGRDVALNVWTRPGDEGRAGYALDALKRAMLWDEATYGRAYDLDVFNIVAIDDFNAGAMENKGLNIFNSAYVLASPETATDADYEAIEGVVAHEYFHNWTGNRVTCRDWFQLSLKEGLTVFRDQQFTADVRSEAVKRIEDVVVLRSRQFREDDGPLAHPVQPQSYIEINNFYTATVYEKGAEVVRMLKAIVGDTAWYDGLALYFERFDGTAATIDDFLGVFEEVTGRDLAQFRRWYSQPGTPRLSVTERYENGVYTLDLAQEVPQKREHPKPAPMHIPVAMALLAADGSELFPTRILELTEWRQTFEFDGIPERPVASLPRGFSAPVILRHALSEKDRLLIFAHDTDPVTRWEAGRRLAQDQIAVLLDGGEALSDRFLAALGQVAVDADLDPAFRALTLTLPAEEDTARAVASAGGTPDPMAIHRAHEDLATGIATALQSELAGLYSAMEVPGPYTPSAEHSGRRSLRIRALDLLTRIEGGERARTLWHETGNMTEGLAALGVLVGIGDAEDEVAEYYARWKHDALTLDKWFRVQVARSAPSETIRIAEDLTRHPDFAWKNPNRFSAVLGALARHPAGFHHPSGAGYDLLADWIARLDALNPTRAARTATAFETWRRYDGDRRSLMEDAMRRIRSTPGISRDTAEVLDRLLTET